MPGISAIALATGEQMLPGTNMGWMRLVGIVLISHAYGQGLIAYALAHSPASFSSISLLLQPVMTGVFAWVPLGGAAGGAADRRQLHGVDQDLPCAQGFELPLVAPISRFQESLRRPLLSTLLPP